MHPFKYEGRWHTLGTGKSYRTLYGARMAPQIKPSKRMLNMVSNIMSQIPTPPTVEQWTAEFLGDEYAGRR